MKESDAFKMLELSGGPSIAHDDRLLIRGQKHEVGLSADYKSLVDIQHRNGEKIVVNWILGGRTEGDPPADVVSTDQYAAMPWAERKNYRPQYLRGLDLGDGISLTMHSNQMDIRICDLFSKLGSRYRSALDTMVELEARGILKYRPRVIEPTEKNRTEAMRNRLWRKVRPTEYEHDILFGGKLGRAIWDDLSAVPDKVTCITGGTIYLKGYQKYKGIRASTKLYDIGIREESESGQYFKLETTLYKAFFKSEGIGIRELTEQPDIQDRLMEQLRRNVASMLSLLSGDTMDMLQAELDIDIRKADRRHTEIATALLHRDRTLTERVRDLEIKQAQMERRLRKIEAKIPD